MLLILKVIGEYASIFSKMSNMQNKFGYLQSILHKSNLYHTRVYFWLREKNMLS